MYWSGAETAPDVFYSGELLVRIIRTMGQSYSKFIISVVSLTTHFRIVEEPRYYTDTGILAKGIKGFHAYFPPFSRGT